MNMHKEIPQKIIKSKSFGRSKTYENLLLYLVECSYNNHTPKETTIAEEIFKKSAFDPSQSTLVRVYVFNLRKKLKQYYQQEGIADKIVLKIPKGSYKVEFIAKEKEKEEVSSVPSKAWILWMLSIALVLSMLLNFYLWRTTEKDFNVYQQGIWADLMQSPLPTMVVIGDLFIYHEIDTSQALHRSIRDPLINSEQEFEKFLLTDNRPTVYKELGTYSYLIRNSVIWIKNLTQIFHEQKKEYAIRLMSRFNPKELQDYNLVVVGMSKTLGLFNNYYQSFKLLRKGSKDYYQYSDGENEYLYQASGDPNGRHTDYGYMGKYPGPNNNSIYIFGGLWDTGASQSFKNFTENSLLKEVEVALKNEFGSIPKFYEIMFEVKGIDRMELGTKILHINSINPQSINDKNLP